MKRLDQAERVLSWILSIATLIGVSLLVERRFKERGSESVGRVEKISDWAQMSESAISQSLGRPGRVSVTVFTDFQCPMCRVGDSLLSALAEEHPDLLERTIVHFPLPGNVHAVSAAKAFECAAVQGHADEMLVSLFRAARSFGVFSWSEIARSSGVTDSAKFFECFGSAGVMQRIHDGIALGQKLQISGTPAYVVDGTLYDAATFGLVAEAILSAGSTPETHTRRRKQ